MIGIITYPNDNRHCMVSLYRLYRNCQRAAINYNYIREYKTHEYHYIHTGIQYGNTKHIKDMSIHTCTVTGTQSQLDRERGMSYSTLLNHALIVIRTCNTPHVRYGTMLS